VIGIPRQRALQVDVLLLDRQFQTLGFAVQLDDLVQPLRPLLRMYRDIDLRSATVSESKLSDK
jgi:hypothetical protein